jgi:outer membrane PBP1 activator LpoA protein
MKANEQREAALQELKKNMVTDESRVIKVSLLKGELKKLQGELDKGRQQRATLDQQLRSADQQILYISGAIKILEELIAESDAAVDDEETG